MKNSPPSAIKAPASIESRRRLRALRFALVSPTVSARWAISTGSSGSKLLCGSEVKFAPHPRTIVASKRHRRHVPFGQIALLVEKHLLRPPAPAVEGANDSQE